MAVVYDGLARECLLMLIESGRLRAAAPDQLVAYETWFLPPRVHLELPDKARFSGLINPHTREEHCASLSEAIFALVRTEESETWIPSADALSVTAELAIGRRSARARPIYEVGDAGEDRRQEEEGEPLLRVKIGEEEEAVLRRGAGLLTVLDARFKPRISLMEAEEGSPEVAFLLLDGPTHVTTSDGRERDYPGPARVALTHDLRFEVGRRWSRPWQGRVEGVVEVLGISRMARPVLVIADRGGAQISWDRNREPALSIGEEEGVRVRSHDLHLRLTSGVRDHIDVASSVGAESWLTWFDGRALRIPASRAVPIQGSHLVALGRDSAVRLSTHIATTAPSPPPKVLEIRGWVPPKRSEDKPFSGLFGFEQPVAIVYEDGQRLDPGLGEGPVRIPVHGGGAVGPLCQVALDGCPGCKVLSLRGDMSADVLALGEGVWSWLEGVAVVSGPGIKWRLEALAKVRLIYGEPHVVAELSADPEDAWSVQGWRVQVVGDELQIAGDGRVSATLDRKPVHKKMTVTLGWEHRVTIGRGLYRIVRRGTSLDGDIR